MSLTRVSLKRRIVDNAHSRIEPVPAGESLFQKPTLLCCGGIMLAEGERELERNTNGFAKLGYGLLGMRDGSEPSDPVDVVTVVYPETRQKMNRDLHAYNHALLIDAPAEVTEFARQFVKDHLAPLIEDNSSHAYPMDTIKRNLRNITVLAHSYGAAFIQQVGDALVEKMQALGLSQAAICECTSQIAVVATGPGTFPASGKASFTTINILNMGDSEIVKGQRADDFSNIDLANNLLAASQQLLDYRNRPIKPQAYYRMGEHTPKQPLTILPVRFNAGWVQPELSIDAESNSLLVCASKPVELNSLGHIIPHPHISPAMARSNARGEFKEPPLTSTHHDPTGHQPQTYLNYGISTQESGTHGFMLRSIVSAVLANSINNALKNQHSNTLIPLGSPASLLESPKELQFEITPNTAFPTVMKVIDYDRRIKQAHLNEHCPSRSL